MNKSRNRFSFGRSIILSSLVAHKNRSPRMKSIARFMFRSFVAHAFHALRLRRKRAIFDVVLEIEFRLELYAKHMTNRSESKICARKTLHRSSSHSLSLVGVSRMAAAARRLTAVTECRHLSNTSFRPNQSHWRRALVCAVSIFS